VRRLALLVPLLLALAVAAPAVAAVPWPAQTLQLGLDDDEAGASALREAAPFGFRYHYLAGGVNTDLTWQRWGQGDGRFVTDFIADSAANGMTAVFSYYEIRQSRPGVAQSDEPRAVLQNLADRATMRAYYQDLQRFFALAGASGRPVVLHVEPDLWGYAQQRGGDDASAVRAAVASTGLPELEGLPDDVSGVARAVVRLRDAAAPNVLLAWHLSIWGTGKDISHSDETQGAIDELASRSVRFYRSLRAPFDAVFAEFADRDSGYAQRNGVGERAWWDAADFARFQRYLANVHAGVKLPVVVWQIPLGNTVSPSLNDTPGRWKDNRVQWLLGPGSRAHLRALTDAGVVALLFGAGQADGTTAKTDGGYLFRRAAAYYAAGALALPKSTRPPRRPRTGPANLRNPGSFSTRARVSRSVVRRGGSVRIKGVVRPTKTQRALVSVEVYRAGKQVFQRYFDHSTLRRGRVRSFSATWSVPADAPAGDYVVKLGVFAPGFERLRSWNDHAARISVRA